MCSQKEPIRVSETISIPSVSEKVADVAEKISAVLERFLPDETARFDVRLAVQEAVMNAVEHGNKNDNRKRVTVEYTVDDEKVGVTVTDEGSGFNPETVPDPTLEENLLKERGRGLFLIRNLVDRAYHNERGNQITMIKFRRAAG